MKIYIYTKQKIKQFSMFIFFIFKKGIYIYIYIIYMKQHNTPPCSAYMFYACASYIHRPTNPAPSLHTKPHMKIV